LEAVPPGAVELRAAAAASAREVVEMPELLEGGASVWAVEAVTRVRSAQVGKGMPAALLA